MKKILVIFFIIGIYLSVTYGYFYNFLGQKRLLPPVHETKNIIGDKSDIQTIVYVALGDSLTEGTGASDYKSSFPYLLSRKLSAKAQVELFNLARAGATSEDVVINQLPKVLSLKPDLITLLIGTNDIHNLVPLKDFESNYRTIAAALKKSGAKVHLLSIPYLGSDKIIYFPYKFALEERTKQFNGVIKKVSIDYGFKYLDLYAIEKSANFYSSDEFHPSDNGYRQWTEVINVD